MARCSSRRALWGRSDLVPDATSEETAGYGLLPRFSVPDGRTACCDDVVDKNSAVALTVGSNLFVSEAFQALLAFLGRQANRYHPLYASAVPGNIAGGR